MNKTLHQNKPEDMLTLAREGFCAFTAVQILGRLYIMAVAALMANEYTRLNGSTPSNRYLIFGAVTFIFTTVVWSYGCLRTEALRLREEASGLRIQSHVTKLQATIYQQKQQINTLEQEKLALELLNKKIN